MRRWLLLDPRGVSVLHDPPGATETVGVVALPALALHRVALFETAPRRLRAEIAERGAALSAEAPEGLHVAAGTRDAEGQAWIAVARAEAMAAIVAGFAPHDPVSIVPAPLLLAAAADVAVAHLPDLTLLRAAEFAASVEPSLGGMMLEGRSAAVEPWPPALPEDGVPLDLRQGRFARRLRWWRERRWQRRLGVLSLLVLLLAVVPAALHRWQAAAEVERLDKAVAAAAAATPGVAKGGDPARALAARRMELEGQGGLARLAALVAALDGGRVRAASLGMAPDGSVIASLSGPAAAIAALPGRLRAGGHAATLDGPVLTVRALAPAASGDALRDARWRAARATRDAAAIRALSRAAWPEPGPAIRAAAAAAGLPDAVILVTPDGRATLGVAAARPRVLLGLLATLANQGILTVSGTIARAGEDSVQAQLTLRVPR
ncbi:hypothetical protein [Sandaracinobacteroides saxicola]|uniref:General secretion pathway protein L n=1 Tax=Sandaracinobacteroides saxicola TaxID=2759707 RepID=A0A7G5IEE7_9SPHN|nr:hypothetical protein [Sandaracinobacteroides saxicola]QMW21739.1 hypothetical protein H3309_10010 [Sandaracinobacteroides saxicola]